MNKLSNTKLINYGIQIKEEPIEFKFEESEGMALSNPLSFDDLIESGRKARVYIDSSLSSKNLIENYIFSPINYQR